MGCNSSASKEKGPPPEKNGGEKMQLLNKYTVGAMLGQGTFGIVYACRPRGSDQDCAVKMVDRVETPEAKITQEANMMKRMDHPNVIKCMDIIYEKCFVCIVMERLKGGDLISAMQAHWKSKGTIPLDATHRVLTQMTKSLEHLHTKYIVHRDVKGDNYLCDRPEVEHPSVRIVLTDFGTVIDCPPETRLDEKCGTKLFWAPELYSRNYAIKVDIWAMGVVFYGLLNGRFPFKDENEVRNKVVKLSDSTPGECKKLLFACLEKSEEKRITAVGILDHPFLQGALPTSGNNDSKRNSTEGEETSCTREFQNPGLLERRQELVERLQDVYMKVSTQTASTGGSALRSSSVQEMHYWKNRFTIKAPRDQGMFAYEWWNAEKVAKELDVSIVAGKKGANRTSILAGTQGDLNITGDTGRGASAEEVGMMLKANGIDITKFGKGQAKTLEELTKEIVSGSAVMMLDASAHKKVVRVVNIVLLRIRGWNGGNKILIEFGEQFADGRTRSNLRLPAAKKEPHENSRQTADRIVKENLASFGKLKVKFDWGMKEIFEEEEESPSYPGIFTVYRKQIVEGYLSNTDSSRVSRTSRPDSVVMDATKTGNELEKMHSKSKLTKFYKWLSEKECQKQGVKFKAPEEGLEVSGLVHAPIGMDESTLRQKLKENNIDVSKFGTGQYKSTTDLSTELVRGECILAADSSGALTRIVDIVVVKIQHPDGRILVEVEHTHANGDKTQLNRLPGAKRRPDENQFLTVRRMLKRTMKIEEDHVIMNDRDVKIVEEEKASVAYPQLRTVYRKRIIPAKLMAKLDQEALENGRGSQNDKGDI